MATPPTFESWTEIAHNSSSTPRSSASISWNTGDAVVVFIEAVDNGTGSPVIATPTATGLTFSLLAGIGTNNQVCISAYGAQAGSGGSSAVSCAISGGTFQWGGNVYRYSGTDGFSNTATDVSAAKVVNLSRGTDNECVVESIGDWGDDILTATWTPSGQTQDLAVATSDAAAIWAAHWGDQGGAIAADYGLATGGSAGPLTKVAVGIKGTAGALEAGPVAAVVRSSTPLG